MERVEVRRVAGLLSESLPSSSAALISLGLSKGDSCAREAAEPHSLDARRLPSAVGNAAASGSPDSSHFPNGASEYSDNAGVSSSAVQ